jgi:D-xylose 1-dehydrogenase (NADP+, D-xylono-1,5-lactone-forming)
MRKLKWGILSTADIGQTQVIPAILRSENAEIAAIASRSEKAKSVADIFSIPTYYESYEDMLRDEIIEAVYIPLPNHLHKEWVIRAAKQGKHVLCEKPASLSAKEALEMMEVCKENGVQFMEAFMYQFHPQHQRVQDIIASGEIGEVKLMRASFSFFLEDRKDNIRMNKAMGGGSIYDVGCYCIHVVRTILQSEPIQVEAFAELDPQSGVDVSAIVYMKLNNGINVVFDSSFDMNFRHEYEIVGTKGRIVVPSAFRPDVNGNIGLILVQSQQGERTEQVSGDQYKNQIEFFSSSIIENTQPSYKLESTLQNMSVIDACYQSIESKHPVKLV